MLLHLNHGCRDFFRMVQKSIPVTAPPADGFCSLFPVTWQLDPGQNTHSVLVFLTHFEGR